MLRPNAAASIPHSSRVASAPPAPSLSQSTTSARNSGPISLDSAEDATNPFFESPFTGTNPFAEDLVSRKPEPLVTRTSSGSGRESGAVRKGSSCCERCNRCCVSCAINFAKFFLVVPNIVFLTLGSLLIGLGLWMRSDRESLFYLELLKNVPASPLVSLDRFPLIIIVIGSLVAILSFLGCCGACVESVCFLCLYTCFLVVVVAAEIIFAIVIVILRHQILSRLEYSLQMQVKFDYGSSDVNTSYEYHMTAAWDNMQKQFQCCGSTGPRDYSNSVWRNKTDKDPEKRGTVVPLSCCYGQGEHSLGGGSAEQFQLSASLTTNCQGDARLYMDPMNEKRTPFKGVDGPALKTQGCNQSMIDRVRKNIAVVVGIVCSFVFLQIVDFAFACAFMRWIRKRQEEIWSDDEYDMVYRD